jgi:nicotinate-nucleotide adenylyltransferase
MPIGILGGTFDPVHFGHLRAALEVFQDLDLAEVRLIPCHIPPHREPPSATPKQRLRMVRAAVAGVPGLRVDDRELVRGGVSYSVDTLRGLRAELADTPLALILGSDAFCGLASWREWRELPRLCHFIVVQRPGWAPPAEGEAARLLHEGATEDPAAVRDPGAGRVLRWTVTQLEISASRIRAEVSAGRSPRYLVPESVRRIIGEEGLYR